MGLGNKKTVNTPDLSLNLRKVCKYPSDFLCPYHRLEKNTPRLAHWSQEEEGKWGRAHQIQPRSASSHLSCTSRECSFKPGDQQNFFYKGPNNNHLHGPYFLQDESIFFPITQQASPNLAATASPASTPSVLQRFRTSFVPAR